MIPRSPPRSVRSIAPTVQSPVLSVVLAMHIVHDDADAVLRHLQPFAVLECPLGVLVAALPMLAHRGAGELVVLGMPFIGFLLIDQLEDGDLGQLGEVLSRGVDAVRMAEEPDALMTWRLIAAQA